jgi:hypothetical protein
MKVPIRMGFTEDISRARGEGNVYRSEIHAPIEGVGKQKVS